MPAVRLLAPLLFVVLATWAAGCSRPNAAESQEAPSADSRVERGWATGSDADARKVVLVLGNSLAAGYGLDPDLAFPALL